MSHALSALPGGRNWGLYRAACTVGKWVAHGVLTSAEVENTLLQCCKVNGYMAKPDVGIRACRNTIDSGLRMSAHDPLPVLPDRPRQGAWRRPPAQEYCPQASWR